MDDVVPIIIVAINIGLCLLAGALLSFRAKKAPVYLPLAIFFFLFAFLNFTTVMNYVAPQYEVILSLLSITIAALLLWPMFWLYIDGLTQETRWRFSRRHSIHLGPAIFGLLTLGLLYSLPQDTRLSYFGDNDPITDTPLAVMAMLCTVSVLLIWCLQTIIYTALGLRRLFRYRRRLKDVFASTENRELTWLLILFIFLGMACVYAFFGSTYFPENDSMMSAMWEELVLLILILTLAIWGLRQSPGFEQLYKDQEKDENTQDPPEEEPSTPTKTADAGQSEKYEKYEKSGLDDVRANRIAGKLERLMQAEQLYLDPNLSLPMLARKLGVSTNILSQTLNETIKSNFFDYVNKYRIAASLPMMSERKNTVLTVAMTVGFNSRSAFYKAFKRETGTTPGTYLKRAHS